MNQNRIQLREVRRIGDIVGDSIQFIKQNFKDILKNTVLLALPLFVLAGILLSLRHFPTFQAYASMLAVTGVILAFIVAVLFYGLICEFMVLYVKNGNKAPSIENLLTALKKDIAMIIITNIFNIIFVFLSFSMLIIPGIYIMIPLSLIVIIRMHEGTTYFAALDKSFRLIAGNWWKSLGMYFIFGILMFLIAGIIYLPFLIIGEIGSLHNKSIKENHTLLLSVAFQFLNQIFNILYLIPLIGSAFLYFSLLEQKEGAGLLERIQAFREKHENK